MLGITKTKKTKVMATSLAESVAGKSFIERARRDAWTLNARSGLWALLIFDLVSFIGHLIVYPYGMPGALLLFHAVALGWGILVWKTKFGAIWNFFVWPIFSCFSIACHLEAVRLDILQYDELVLENASVLISIVFISTMLMPGPVRNSLATGVFAVVASYFATRGYTMQAAYCVLVLLTSIGGVAWNAASVHIVEEMASSSLFMRATMAPAHVAEHTIDHLGAASGFPVAERHTSVVVIKWSEIAARSHDMLPAALNVLLTSYFSIVDQILINQLPRGTWFADVIQHEIHVYLFSDELNASTEQEALNFAIQLMTLRSVHSELDVMGYLDIGIASGPVVSGIIGPRLYQKTAAIGPPAGVAIAAKTLGVPLRNAIGGSDRILFDSAFTTKISAPLNIQSIWAPDMFSGRRWDDQLLFVIERPVARPPLIVEA